MNDNVYLYITHVSLHHIQAIGIYQICDKCDTLQGNKCTTLADGSFTNNPHTYSTCCYMYTGTHFSCIDCVLHFLNSPCSTYLLIGSNLGSEVTDIVIQVS